MSDVKNKLNQLYDLENCGLAILDSQSCILHCNYSFKKLFGYLKNELINQSIDLIFKDTDNNIINDMLTYANNVNTNHVNKKHINAYHKNSSIISVECSISSSYLKNDEIYFLLIHDMSKLEDTIDDINSIAYYDSLTNIPNRRLFFDRFHIAISQAKRLNHKLGILYIDIDAFKDINDKMGHEAGDILLVEFAKRLVECVRDSDTVARVGGDEFAIILLNIYSRDDIYIAIERILNKNKIPININNYPLKISFSIGLSIYPDSGKKINTLLKKADLDMYKKKQS